MVCVLYTEKGTQEHLCEKCTCKRKWMYEKTYRGNGQGSVCVFACACKKTGKHAHECGGESWKGERDKETGA